MAGKAKALTVRKEWEGEKTRERIRLRRGGARGCGGRGGEGGKRREGEPMPTPISPMDRWR